VGLIYYLCKSVLEYVLLTIQFPCNLIKTILFFKFLCVYLLLKKLINKKYFSVKKYLAWFLKKCFPRKFGRKTLSENYEKIKNVILFADYIKFDPQTFDCYIYFVLNIYFSISSLKI